MFHLVNFISPNDLFQYEILREIPKERGQRGLKSFRNRIRKSNFLKVLKRISNIERGILNVEGKESLGSYAFTQPEKPLLTLHDSTFLARYSILISK